MKRSALKSRPEFPSVKFECKICSLLSYISSSIRSAHTSVPGTPRKLRIRQNDLDKFLIVLLLLTTIV